MLIFASFISCKTQQVKTKNTIVKGDHSMTSVDWPGTYQGILPCADCKGIKTELVLNDDLTYTLNNQYLEKSDSVFTENGKFIWNNLGSTIKLNNLNNQFYQVGENILFQLDKNGNRISGKLADNYVLKKKKIEITNKYWKLIRLNGQSVKQGISEPYIRLNDDFSVNGNSSCNRFNGTYELPESNKIRFSPFAMTKMACLDDKIENEFMQVIEKTTSYSVSSNELIFQDENETSLAIFVSDFFK